MIAPAPKPWEQLHDEPEKWYRLLIKYISMGSERSLVNVFKNESPRNATKCLPGGWADASKQWQWVERAAAYDLAQAKALLAKTESDDEKYVRTYKGAANNMAKLLLDVTNCETIEELQKIRVKLAATTLAVGKGGLANATTASFKVLHGTSGDRPMLQQNNQFNFGAAGVALPDEVAIPRLARITDNEQV